MSSVDALTDAPEPLRLANPMSSEMQLLRTSLRGSILKTLASNQRVSQRRGLRLFEIGRVFLPREEAKERVLPDEREMLVGVLSGPRFPTSWRAPEGDMGFFDAKGALESLFEQVGAPGEYEPSNGRKMRPGAAARLHGGRAAGHPPPGAVVQLLDLELLLLYDELLAVHIRAARQGHRYAHSLRPARPPRDRPPI